MQTALRRIRAFFASERPAALTATGHETEPGLSVPGLSRRHAIRFTLAFAVLAGSLLGFYYFPYAEGSPVRPALDGFLHVYAVSAGLVLRCFEPHVRVVGADIIGRYSLRLVKTCDAMDVTILLVSAILAWPLPWRSRLAGVAGGIFFVFSLNILRICSLYWIGISAPAMFEVAHLDVWPAIILLMTIAFFWLVVVRAGAVASSGQA